ncbi:MAG: helix-turn-helix domain-containing protein [Moorellaceae bacterium]
MAHLGNRLRFYRLKRHLTLKEVESMTGLHSTTISGYERGIREPSQEILRMLAAVYEVPVAYLLLDENELSNLVPEEYNRILTLLNQRPDLAKLLEEIKDFPQPLVNQLRRVIQGIRELPASKHK